MNDRRKTINVAEPVHRVLKAYAKMSGHTVAGLLTELSEEFLQIIKDKDPELYKELTFTKGHKFKILIDD